MHKDGLTMKNAEEVTHNYILHKIISIVTKRWNGVNKINMRELEIAMGDLRNYEQIYSNKLKERRKGQKKITEFIF